MLRTSVLFVCIASILFSCKENHLQLSENNVEKIELVWVAHHYHNPEVDYYELNPEVFNEFMDVFNGAEQLSPPVDYTCFEIVVYWKDGGKENYITNGEIIRRVRTGEYFAFNMDYNVITHFWGIPEKDFCVKNH